MHTNIDKILRRASGLIASSWLDPATPTHQHAALQEAYAKLNPGRRLDRVKSAPTLPMDPDGSETLSAARLVAEALGLRMAGHAELDEGRAIGPGHLVVLRTIEGQEDPHHPRRQSLAREAGFTVEIVCQDAALEQAVRRRRKAGGSDPRQPSLF